MMEIEKLPKELFPQTVLKEREEQLTS